MADRADLGIIDLTKVAAPDIRVKLRGADDKDTIYRIPGNAPSGLMVEMMVLLREIDAADGEDLELISDLRNQVQEKVDDLFCLRNADYQAGDVELGDEELAALVSGLFQRYYNVSDEEGGDRPTEPQEAEEEQPSTSTPPRPRSAPRSPRRSPARKTRSRSSTSSQT